MSQINDALKRVSQTQEAPSMHSNENGLEHVEEPVPKQSSIPIVIFPILLFLILAFAAFFLVRGMDRKKAFPIHARETQSAVDQSQSAADQEPTPTEQTPVAKPANLATAVPSAARPVVATNAAPATAAGPNVPAPAPGGYKVNSIFYKPKNPAAVVNSKMVYVGDRIGDAKVVAIEKDAVIIEVEGEKKALTLF
jgi:MSHA biogenesis protein MshK